MHHVSSAKEKLYRKFRGGDIGALAELLEGERGDLYDYLLRMTGQVTRSVETIDEVYQSLTEETFEDINSYAALKLCLYVTARKFNADIWNADTTRLVNAAIEGNATPGEPASKEQQDLVHLDHALRCLPGPVRDAVCLALRGGFDYREIGELIGLSDDEAETWVKTGARRIDADCGGTSVTAEMWLARVPNHPPPLRSSQATVNLSMVMQGIQARPIGLWSPARMALLALAMAAVATWLVWPELPAKVWEMVKPQPRANQNAGG